MKKTFIFFLTILAMATCGVIDQNKLEAGKSYHSNYYQNREQTVFVTKTGAKYHRASCQYLKNSRIQINKEQAAQLGYTPCKVCRPN